MDRYNLISFLGLIMFMAIAWMFSANRRNINWRVVTFGLIVQLLFGLFIFRVPAGMRFFLFVNDVVMKLLEAASKGVQFVFGPLSVGPGNPGSIGFILAFQALPLIVFFSALMAVLYYFRIMPLIVKGFAYVFTKLMKISGAESLCAASNIFVGVEAAFVIRPHLKTMTRSELCVVLTTGMATIASNVLAFYVICLNKAFPNIAGHLVTASIITAPAAVIMAKLIYPEDGKPDTLGTNIEPHYEREKSVFEAIINGANGGMALIFGIVALLLAMLGLLEVVNMAFTWVGFKINAAAGWYIDWSLEGLLSYVFYPLVILTGISPADSIIISKIVGMRTIATEVPAYQMLGIVFASGQIVSIRSAVITAYILCGFAHIASLAIFVGGTSALVPERVRDLSSVAIRALIAATLACFMAGCIAGIFITDNASILFR